MYVHVLYVQYIRTYVHTYILTYNCMYMYNTCITSLQLTDLNPFFFLLLFNLDKNCEDLLSALYICTLGKGREDDPRIHI